MEHHGEWVHQTLPQSGKTTVQQRVPRVNLTVQMRETGMKLPSPTPAPQASRLGTPSAGDGTWYAGHSKCVMVPCGPSCYSVLSLLL